MNPHLLLELQLELAKQLYPYNLDYLLRFEKIFKRLPTQKETELLKLTRIELKNNANVFFVDSTRYHLQFINNEGIIAGLTGRCLPSVITPQTMIASIKAASLSNVKSNYIIGFVTEEQLYYDIVDDKPILTIESLYE